MVQHPAVADVSKALWSFASPSQVFLDKIPGLVGTRFGDLALRFADGLVLGLLNRRSGQCDIAPPADTLVRSAASLSLKGASKTLLNCNDTRLSAAQASTPMCGHKSDPFLLPDINSGLLLRIFPNLYGRILLNLEAL